MCVWCGVERARPNRRHCRGCADKFALYDKRRSSKLKAGGMCIKCGKVPPRPNRKTCRDCREKNTAAGRAKSRGPP